MENHETRNRSGDTQHNAEHSKMDVNELVERAMREAQASASPIDTPLGRARRYRLRALFIIVPLAVLCFVVWTVLQLVFLGRADEGVPAVVIRLVGVLPWLALFAVCFVSFLRKLLGRDADEGPRTGEQGEKDRPSIGQRTVMVVVLGLIAVTAYIFVAAPLLDVPYLFDPVRVELHDAKTRENDSYETTSYYLEGTDASGKRWSFRINQGTYYSWDSSRTDVTVTGLPHTHVTLKIE